MADKSFDIQDLLVPHRVISTFLREKNQLSVEEEAETRRIASVRIHIERAIERVKNYHILQALVYT